MSDMNKIKERIRKMLALANNNPEAEEAETAMRMAIKLLAKHGLEMTDIPDTDGTYRPELGPVVEENWTHHLNFPWARRLAAAIARLYFCEYFFYNTHVTGKKNKQCIHVFVGQQNHAEVARQLAQWVIGAVNKQAQKERRENGHDFKFVTAFWQGAANRISERACEMRDEMRTTEQSDPDAPGTALVPLTGLYDSTAEANARHLEQYKLTTRKSREKSTFGSEGYERGHRYGSTVNLNRQIGAQ